MDLLYQRRMDFFAQTIVICGVCRKKSALQNIIVAEVLAVFGVAGAEFKYFCELGRYQGRHSRSLPVHKTHEFHARAAIGAENTQHGAGHARGVLFFHAPHGHAKVKRFNDDRHPQRLQRLLEASGDLVSQSLLHLKPPGEHIDDPGDLAESDDPALGNVRHVAFAVKRQ